MGCPHAHALVGITDDGLDAFTILASATGNVGTGMGGEKNMGRAQAGNWSGIGSFVVVQREEGKREMTREDRLFMVRGVHDEVMSWNAENRKGDVVGNRDGGESMNDDSSRDSRDISCEMSKFDRPHDEKVVLDEEKHAENDALNEENNAKGKGNGDKERDDEKKDDEKRTVENPIMPVMSVDKQDSVEPVSSPGVQGVHTSKKMHKNIYIYHMLRLSLGGECTSGEERTGT